MTANENSLLYLVSTVLRARGFRLYTKGGRRLVDLWQNGGAAVLGHTPPNLLKEIKNTASRGLYSPFPHFHEARFVKALSALLPGYFFKLYNSAPIQLKSLFENGGAGFWRPFFDAENPFTIPANAPPILIPIIPGVQSWRDDLPQGLCVAAAGTEKLLEDLPAGDILPPVLLAAASRGVYDLIASGDRAKPVFPRITKALKKNGWQQTGIYINPKEKPGIPAWKDLFCRFLDAGFLLPPVTSQPVILPGELSPGEEVKLAAAFESAEI